jgi:hypothetical protein
MLRCSALDRQPKLWPTMLAMQMVVANCSTQAQR